MYKLIVGVGVLNSNDKYLLSQFVGTGRRHSSSKISNSGGIEVPTGVVVICQDKAY